MFARRIHFESSTVQTDDCFAARCFVKETKDLIEGGNKLSSVFFISEFRICAIEPTANIDLTQLG